MSLTEMTSSAALIVVDVQNDFCPGGALAVPEGDAVVAPLNHWIDMACRAGAVVVASRDWHPPHHASFKERGGQWPPHCVQHTEGARFHPDLCLPEEAIIVTKGDDPNLDQYSAFDGTGLADRLRDRSVRRVFVGGLALDVCVQATALDAREAGFAVSLLEDATRAVNPERRDEVLERLREAGVERARTAGVVRG